MIVEKQTQNRGIEIDLTGPQGNEILPSWNCKESAKQLDLDETAICDEMTSGDYENLVQVFDKNFGSIVTLYR